MTLSVLQYYGFYIGFIRKYGILSKFFKKSNLKYLIIEFHSEYPIFFEK